jgi:hypothetical protein
MPRSDESAEHGGGETKSEREGLESGCPDSDKGRESDHGRDEEALVDEDSEKNRRRTKGRHAMCPTVHRFTEAD